MADAAKLRLLIEAVEAGTASYDMFSGALGSACQDVRSAEIPGYAASAYRGALGAAESLHDALLPGWGWDVGIHADTEPNYEACVTKLGLGQATDAHSATGVSAARAWLLATLKAHEASHGS